MSLRSYPFATSKGVPIPLEAAQPLRSFLISSDVGLYTGWIAENEVLQIVPHRDCRIYLGTDSAPVMTAQPLPFSAYLVAATAVSLVASGTILAIAAVEPDVVAQAWVTVIEPWKSLANVVTLEYS